ncbi:MAG: SDR family oxidoreductase [Symploca sp. SIO3E6]|nr:SDR family oxidoreductase [Caldora sp. SIO3E6]
MNQNIEGKVIVITGASSGIGEATARHLASLGAKVVLGARRLEKLEKVAAEIQATGSQATVLKTDVTVASDVKALVDEAYKTFGRLDVMINNAGLMALAPMSETKVDEWERMIDINIKGVLYGIAAALPIFEEQGNGHFINISSVAGIKVFGLGGAVYSGTKFAVRAISEGLRVEVGSKIRVTTIEPGAINSELKYGSSNQEIVDMLVTSASKIAIPADAIARAIAYAIEQPAEVDINEIVVRPTSQEF